MPSFDRFTTLPKKNPSDLGEGFEISGIVGNQEGSASGDACHCCRICLCGIELGDAADLSVGNVHP